jgi:hypothetical protein
MLPLLSIMLLVTSPLPSFGQTYSASYDSYIQYAVDKYWTDFPYPWAWKAQLYQESRLNPKAVSPVGAKGLAQFMPATWAQMTRNLGWGEVSPFSPKHSIIAGSIYMRDLRRKWFAHRTVWDRHWLAAASYNGGLGNILAAQSKCSGVAPYDAIMRCLPLITGKHAKETLGYAEFISRHWSRMAPGYIAYSTRLGGPVLTPGGITEALEP